MEDSGAGGAGGGSGGAAAAIGPSAIGGSGFDWFAGDGAIGVVVVVLRPGVEPLGSMFLWFVATPKAAGVVLLLVVVVARALALGGGAGGRTLGDPEFSSNRVDTSRSPPPVLLL